MRQGVDYAWGSPDVKALKAAGKSFVVRYLSHDPSKDLREGEAKVLRANGIDICTIWESTANRALAGALAGQDDARSAIAELHALGAPPDAPVYFAVDFDVVTPAQRVAVLNYLRGAGNVLGRNRVGVYGGIKIVQAALDAKVCRYAWQTLAWSYGKWDPRAHIRQTSITGHVAGVSVDLDDESKLDFGQWERPKPPKKKFPWSGVPKSVLYAWLKWRAARLAANKKKKK